MASLLAFVLVAGGVGYAGVTYQRCKTAPPEGATVAFEVPEGSTGEAVVAALAERGLIRCGGFVGNLLLRGTGKATQIRAGTYPLAAGMTLDEILTVLTTPPPKVPTIRLTIPEGLRIASAYPRERSIASVVQDRTGIPAKTFAALARSEKGLSLPPYLTRGRPLEGFLFPDTYQLVRKGLTAEAVIQKLLDQFRTVAATLPWQNAKRLGLSPYQVVIVASMIEREAGVAKDRPLIASVIYNRLAQGMTLGIDATLLYDDPTPDGKLSTADLATNGPYNTRLTAGLPPTPIANPGLLSLQAALSPASTHYLYYVLCPKDGAGVSRFARTYAQHLANVKACLG